MLHNLDQPIIAQCTPQGSGAIALLRLSGSHAQIIADTISLLPKNKNCASKKLILSIMAMLSITVAIT